MSSGSPRSTSGVEEPGHSDEKWATVTRHTWTRTNDGINVMLLPTQLEVVCETHVGTMTSQHLQSPKAPSHSLKQHQ